MTTVTDLIAAGNHELDQGYEALERAAQEGSGSEMPEHEFKRIADEKLFLVGLLKLRVKELGG